MCIIWAAYKNLITTWQVSGSCQKKCELLIIVDNQNYYGRVTSQLSQRLSATTSRQGAINVTYTVYFTYLSGSDLKSKGSDRSDTRLSITGGRRSGPCCLGVFYWSDRGVDKTIRYNDLRQRAYTLVMLQVVIAQVLNQFFNRLICTSIWMKLIEGIELFFQF